MTISTLSRKEKDAIYTAKYRANNPEKVREAAIRWKANNSEKVKAGKAKWDDNNREKIKVVSAKYRANNPGQTILSWAQTKYKTPMTELRQIIPQELIDVKLLQLTLHRLIKEKGLNNEPERI